MILKFQKYYERNLFTPAKTDSPTTSAGMNQVNKLSQDIEEFVRKKVEVSNIYATYGVKDENGILRADESDLINKLSARKFCDKVNSKMKIKFHNELIGLWAQACDKRRQLDDMNKEVKKIEGNMKADADNVKTGATAQDVFNQNTDLNKSKIKTYADKAKALEKEIVAIENKCKEFLGSQKKNLGFLKTRLDKYRLDRFSEFREAK